MSLAKPLLLALIVAMSSGPPTLAPCPKTPNCVSTQSTHPDKQMSPIPFRGDLESSRTRLLDLLSGLPRVEVVEARERYIHAVFTTPMLRFKDDVEFLLDPAAEVIHFRSASRIGRSDLGTNRRRMEELSAAYAADDTP